MLSWQSRERINIKCDLIYNKFSVYDNATHEEILLASGQENTLFILQEKTITLLMLIYTLPACSEHSSLKNSCCSVPAILRL